ncbi:MAG: hypothetical protein R2865_01705 [Deinococcales bacterium]
MITSYHHVQGQWVYSAETPSQPGEIFWQWGDGLEQISHSNQAFVKRYGLIEAEPRSLKSADDPELSYWSMKPQKPVKIQGAGFRSLSRRPHQLWLWLLF